MPSPFPGMDPYLEDPDVWPDVQAGLLASISALLNAGLRSVSCVARIVEHTLPFDLLRFGTPTVTTSEPTAYRVLLELAGTAERRVWGITLRERLPVVPIPLREADTEVALDLQASINLAYDHAEYGSDTTYSKPPKPPFDDDDATWSEAYLRAKGVI